MKGKEGNREKCPVKWKRISPLGCVWEQWRFAWTPSCFFLRGVVTATWKIYAFCLLEEQISPSRSLSSCGVVFWVRFASDDKCKTEIASLLFVFVLFVCYFAYFFFVLFCLFGVGISPVGREHFCFCFVCCLLQLKSICFSFLYLHWKQNLLNIVSCWFSCWIFCLCLRGAGTGSAGGRGLLGRGCQPFSSLIFYTIAKIKKPCCRALIFDFWIRLSYTCFVSLTSVFTQRF